MSECASRRVESYSQMRRLFFFYEFEYVFGESEKDGHVRTFGIDHRMTQECVVHLEDQRVSVYQK